MIQEGMFCLFNEPQHYHPGLLEEVLGNVAKESSDISAATTQHTYL